MALRARIFPRGEIARARGHGGLEKARLPHQDDPAVVRNVEPLVCVGGPRLRELDAIGQIGALRGRRRPKTERAIDMDPCVLRAGRLADRSCRVDGARIDVAGLDADDARARKGGQFVPPASALAGRRRPGSPVHCRSQEAQSLEQ